MGMDIIVTEDPNAFKQYFSEHFSPYAEYLFDESKDQFPMI